jgi:rod shape-determining protein MreC
VATPVVRRRITSGVFALLVVLTISIFTGGPLALARATGRVIVAPLTWAVDLVAHPVGHLLTGALNYGDVVAQNRALRAEVARDRQILSQQQFQSTELQQLTSSLNLPFVGAIPTITAQVIGTSPTNFASTITLSRGESDGVLPGMPVVGSGGLLGSVTSTTSHSAVVTLITDASSAITGQIGTSGVQAVVYGSGDSRPLRVTAVALAKPVSPGDVVSTTGASGDLFPPGIPVATVKSIVVTPGATTYNLTLTPSADVNNLGYVSVLLWEPGT